MTTARRRPKASFPRRGARWTFAAVLLASLSARPTPAVAEGEATPAAPAPAPTPTPRLSLERIVGAGAPYTRGGPPVASWRPGRDAWVEWRGQGAQRALWEVDAATGKATRLVGRADVEAARPDDEPDVGMRGIGRAGPPDHLWSLDGNALVFPVRGDLVHVDLATGTRHRLTRTPAPISDVRLSPDGRRVAYAREHDLWCAEVSDDGPRERRLTTGGSDTILNAGLDWVYPEELDCATGAWWSPDSTRVAYLSLDETRVPRFPIADPVPRHGAVREQLYPKAGDPNPVPSVHVVGLDGAAPVRLDLGPDPDVYVPWVAWWPDGTKVAVAVLDRAQRHLVLRLCDAKSGASTVFLAEEDPAWVDVPPPPRFLAKGDAFLWRSRRDGAWRLWLVPLDGTAPRALTPPSPEVDALVGVDEAAGAVYYAALTPNRLRTAVWATTLDGAAPRRVTDDASSHAASFSTTGRWMLDTASRATVPPATVARSADGGAARPLSDAATEELTALALEPPEFVTLPGEHGLVAMISKPRPFDPARTYPLILAVYGGPGSSQVRDAWRGPSSLFDAFLCEAGFVVAHIDGRGTSGRGAAYERLVHRRLGTCEVEDLRAAVDALSTRPWIDRKRVGVWGWSYGGYLAALALGRAPDVFRAAVAVAPVTDWSLYDTIYTERYMGRPDENPEGYRLSAPTTWAKDVTGALLLAHGLSDDNVHFQNTARLLAALTEAGRPYDLLLYPQRAHGIEGPTEHLHLFRRLVEHFRRNL